MDSSNNSRKVQVNVLLFANAKDLAKTSNLTAELPSEISGYNILQEIVKILPSLLPLSSNLLLALNQTYIELGEELHLKNSDEIAIIPPIRTTRDTFKGKKVVQLDYEAYIPMAEKELKKICEDIRTKWEVVKIAVIHRIGMVPIGETSVAIAISSVHRKESLEAVQYCIDTLKATVPIWKKETYEDGESLWKENKECCGNQA